MQEERQREYVIGDEVTDDGANYYKITDIKVQEIKTFTKGVLKFTRLYFGEKHPPIWSYNVKGKK